MQRLLPTAAALLILGIGSASAQDKMTLQLKWVTQAQFAGYYVAKDKGFYKEVGLDVTVKPGGPDVNPSQVIAGGGADVIVDWMPSALATREKGVPLINIAQVFQRSGMMLTCRVDSGIKTPADFKGRKLGYLDTAAYERTVAELLAGKSDPVISKKPIGAFTHAIWEAAQK